MIYFYIVLFIMFQEFKCVEIHSKYLASELSVIKLYLNVFARHLDQQFKLRVLWLYGIQLVSFHVLSVMFWEPEQWLLWCSGYKPFYSSLGVCLYVGSSSIFKNFFIVIIFKGF